MTREEAITIMQLYKEELEHRIAKIDYDIREIDLYSIHLDAFEVAIKALSAEVKENRPKPDYSYEADMVRRLKESLSADAVSREEYEETDGVIKIKKQSAKDVGEIKHIVVCSPNYTRYFYNDSMPTQYKGGDTE